MGDVRHVTGSPEAAAGALGFEAEESFAEGVHAVIRREPVGMMFDANNVFIVNDADVVVVDANATASSTRATIAALRAITAKPVRFVVNTHWHFDHSGGNEALAKAGAIIVAHESVRERMGEAQVDEDSGARVAPASAAALPVVTFPDSMALQLDGERMALVHVAAAHTDADVIVRWQEAAAVHLGDL